MDDKDTVLGWRVKVNGMYVTYTSPVTPPELRKSPLRPTALSDCYYAIGAFVQFDKQASASNNEFQFEFEKVTHAQYLREQVSVQLRSALMDARDCGFSEEELVALLKEPS